MKIIIALILGMFQIATFAQAKPRVLTTSDKLQTLADPSTSPVTPTTNTTSVTTPVVGGYKWIQRTIMYPCDENGNSDPNRKTKLSKVNQKFTVTKVDTSGFVFFTIDEYKDSAKFLKYNDGYYYVQTTFLNICAVKNLRVNGSLAFGIINFPFKFRPQSHANDFSGSFNFGAALGVNFGHYAWNKWSFTLLSSYSISNVNLDSVSVSKNSNKLSSTNNYTAFSFAVGMMISYDKIQAGVFVGADVLSRINEATYDWRYQGKPWISVGFGYSIFAGSNKTTEGTGGN